LSSPNVAVPSGLAINGQLEPFPEFIQKMLWPNYANLVYLAAGGIAIDSGSNGHIKIWENKNIFIFQFLPVFPSFQCPSSYMSCSLENLGVLFGGAEYPGRGWM
jgi:hypothetical protein